MRFEQSNELSNQLAKENDVTSSVKAISSLHNNIVSDKFILLEKMIDLVGFLEDGEWELYGLSEEEYMNPTIDIIKRLEEKINSEEAVKTR